MLHIKVIAPDRMLYEGEARSVTVPAYHGQLQALPAHAPYVTLLTEGTLFLENERGEKQQFDLSGTGLLRIDHDRVTVLIDA